MDRPVWETISSQVGSKPIGINLTLDVTSHLAARRETLPIKNNPCEGENKIYRKESSGGRMQDNVFPVQLILIPAMPELIKAVAFEHGSDSRNRFSSLF